MRDIIIFENYQKKAGRKDIPAKTVEISNEDRSITDFVRYMAAEVSKIQKKPLGKLLEKREDEERNEFEEKHCDVLAAAPISCSDRISYFANILLYLLPSVFHNRHKNQFFSDFSMFYLFEFDAAYCEYRSDNKNYEKEYPFRFPSLDADALENALQNCLRQIVHSNDKTEIMWQASRLFELYHNMLDSFST